MFGCRRVLYVLETISLLSICILIVGVFSLSIAVIRKDSRYIGNRLFALAMRCIGCYGICILIYQLFPSPLIIQIFERVAYVFAISGTFIIYLSMQVLAHSKDWLNHKSNVLPFIVIIAVFFVIFFLSPGIITIQSYAPVNTVLDTTFSVVIGILVMYFLLSSIYVIYKYGLRKADPERRKHMSFVIEGIAIIVGGLVLNIFSDLVGDVILGSTLDAIYFLVMCIGTIFVTIGLMKKTKEN